MHVFFQKIRFSLRKQNFSIWSVESPHSSQSHCAGPYGAAYGAETSVVHISLKLGRRNYYGTMITDFFYSLFMVLMGTTFGFDRMVQFATHTMAPSIYPKFI